MVSMPGLRVSDMVTWGLVPRVSKNQRGIWTVRGQGASEQGGPWELKEVYGAPLGTRFAGDMPPLVVSV